MEEESLQGWTVKNDYWKHVITKTYCYFNVGWISVFTVEEVDIWMCY